MNAATVDILRAIVVARDAANAGEYHHFDFPAPQKKTGSIQNYTRQ